MRRTYYGPCTGGLLEASAWNSAAGCLPANDVGSAVVTPLNPGSVGVQLIDGVPATAQTMRHAYCFPAFVTTPESIGERIEFSPDVTPRAWVTL